MKAVAGVFLTRNAAERAAQALASEGIRGEKIAVLIPGETREEVELSVPVSSTERPGMGKALGGVVGAAAGAATGIEAGALATAVIPGIGPVIALGILGAAVLGTIGAFVGGKVDWATTEGLPEDELFVYEDALRRGRSVLLAFVDDENTAAFARRLIEEGGAESIDAARKEWWIGLRDAEEGHYKALGRNLRQEGHFYKLGFETALHAGNPSKQWEQALQEKAAEIERLKRRYPNAEAEESFRRGFESAQAHFDSWRDEHP
jgi:hypothetical protein